MADRGARPAELRGATLLCRLADVSVDHKSWRGLIETRDSVLVLDRQFKRPIAFAVALRIMHYRQGIIVCHASPIVVFKARAGLWSRLLMSCTQCMPELVPEDACQGKLSARR